MSKKLLNGFVIKESRPMDKSCDLHLKYNINIVSVLKITSPIVPFSALYTWNGFSVLNEVLL